ncbi:MAG TPA: PfkB family carbohydrate kinase, partial [Acidimicrobiia bacterium]|nr:PfkB family carbohydrate kinase [Acidimicrobiia bacterium]
MAPRSVAPVVCVGALHLDAKARVIGSLVSGTSNPAAVTRSPGGVAANIARSLARLEVPVALVSVVGDDDIGHRLLGRLAAEGVDVDGVVVTSAAITATYTAVLQGSGELAFGIADMGIY